MDMTLVASCFVCIPRTQLFTLVAVAVFLCPVNELLEKKQGDINKKFAFFSFSRCFLLPPPQFVGCLDF